MTHWLEQYETHILSFVDTRKKNKFHVREVSDRFEFFSDRFAQSPVPTMKCCVPDRVRWALSNSRFRFYCKINDQEILIKILFCTMVNNKNIQYSVNIFESQSVPLAKLISFDAVWRALSNGVFKIVITQTNETFRSLKPIKIGFPEIFHRTIRSMTCATCETYCIRLSLTSSIDWCTFHYY